MTRLFGHSIRSELLLLYVLESLICFGVIYTILLYSGVSGGRGGDRYEVISFSAGLAFCCGVISAASGLYQPEGWRRAGRFVASTLIAALLLSVPANVVLALLAPGADNWGRLAELLIAFVSVIVLTRLAYALVQDSGLMVRRLAVMRGPEGGFAFERELAQDGRNRDAFGIVAVIPPTASCDVEILRAHRIWGVITPAAAGAMPEETRAALRDAGVSVLTETEFLEQRLNRVDVERLAPDWLAATRRSGLAERALRRALDIAGSVAILVFTLPVLLLTAIAIKLDSAGPVFYRQERVGLGGRVFSLFKFRSMRADAEAAGAPRWASRRDSRVTRVGRFIRLTRIDEIPQVINVLRGDMSLVGPRPERPVFVEQLGRIIPHYHDRAIVKPGITGWAQVNYPYGASVEDARMKLAYDLYYVARRSLFLDLLILVATVRVILFQEGAR